MTKILLRFAGIFFMMIFWMPATAQGVVEYGFKSNGKEIREDHPLLISYTDDIAVLHLDGEDHEEFIDYQEGATYASLNFEGKKYTNKIPFSALEPVQFSEETDKILGYTVKKAETVLFSNHIEIWYTDELNIKGTPSLQIGPQLGLVLKIIRNGNYEIYAKKIEKGNVPEDLKPRPKPGIAVNEAELRALQIKSRYQTIPVFEKAQINFGDKITNPELGLAEVVYRFAEGTVIAKKVSLPEDFKGNVFATLTQSSKGDAYDRTGSAFVIPITKEVNFKDALEKGIENLPFIEDKNGKKYPGMTATEEFDPVIELIRFYTPFGVGAFNNKREIAGYQWADSVTYKQDVTELLPYLKGEVWIGAYIGNYDKNGHEVSLELNYYPGQSKKEYYVQPLFNTLNVMEMAGQTYAGFFGTDTLEVKAYVPEDVTDLQLRYISTGHGGWGGGDEFNQKLNSIFVDDELVYAFIPWRTDCATHRLKNPSSGNFGSGLSSSDLSRSGWCPGTPTNPEYISLGDLSPGWHTFKVAIPQGEPEGNSFSYWNISGVLIGKKK